MVDHVRQQIRDAFKAAITAGVPGLVSVTGARGYGYNKDRLPAAEVSTPGSETSAQDVDGDVMHRIDVTVTVLSGDAEPEDGMDALAVLIDAAVHGDAAIAALVQQVNGASSSFAIGDGGDGISARMVLVYSTQAIGTI